MDCLRPWFFPCPVNASGDKKALREIRRNGGYFINVHYIQFIDLTSANAMAR